MKDKKEEEKYIVVKKRRKYVGLIIPYHQTERKRELDEVK